MHRVTMSSAISSFEQKGDILYFEGIVLAPGTYKGLDGHKITYSKEVINNSANSILNKPIFYSHDHDKIDVIGFITRRYLDMDGSLRTGGYIFDQSIMTEVRNGQANGISAEANVDTHWDSKEQIFHAKYLEFDGIAIVKNPACPTSQIETIKMVKLEVNSMSEEIPTDEEIQTALSDVMPQINTDELAKSVSDTIIENLKTFEWPTKVPPKEPEEPPKEPDKEVEQKMANEEKDKLTATIEELTKQLEDTKRQLVHMGQKEIDRQVEIIKTHDKGFDPKTIIEGVEDRERQIALLQAYEDTIKKAQAKVQLSVTDEEKKKKVDEMFEKAGTDLLGPEWKTFLADKEVI